MINPCRSNLLPILITLFCCAGLFLFFNLRLNELKITVEKQNRVLTAFITNVQQDIKSSGSGSSPLATEPTKHFAAPEALIAARKQEVDKIVVSDDEGSDSESESESESESDSESDSDDESEAGDIKVVNLREINLLQMIPTMTLEPVSFEPVSFEVLSCVNLNNESSIASESSITEIMEEPLNLVNLLGKSESTEETTLGKSDDEPNYEQMKVDDLRKIVTDKSLCTKEEGKKLKKPELLGLLKK